VHADFVAAEEIMNTEYTEIADQAESSPRSSDGIPTQRDTKNYQLGIPRDNSPAERHRAVRFLASRANDAEDLGQLLEMLGLQAEEGRHSPEE
jgi:hypothetical protein